MVPPTDQMDQFHESDFEAPPSPLSYLFDEWTRAKSSIWLGLWDRDFEISPRSWIMPIVFLLNLLQTKEEGPRTGERDTHNRSSQYSFLQQLDWPEKSSTEISGRTGTKTRLIQVLASEQRLRGIWRGSGVESRVCPMRGFKRSNFSKFLPIDDTRVQKQE